MTPPDRTARRAVRGAAIAASVLLTLAAAPSARAQGVPTVPPSGVFPLNNPPSGPGITPVTNPPGSPSGNLAPIVFVTLQLRTYPYFTTAAESAASFARLGTAQETLMVGARPLAAALIGGDGPIDASDQVGALFAVGSALGGASGRYQVAPGLTLLGGAGYAAQNDRGVRDGGGAILALALRYEAPAFGMMRPFGEVSFWAMPGHTLRFTRSYTTLAGPAVGTGTTRSDLYDAALRLGLALVPDPADEIAVSVEAGPEWLTTGAYTEAASPENPYQASISGGTAAIVVGAARLAWTHRFRRVSFTVGAAVAHGFDPHSGPNGTVPGLPHGEAILARATWAEFGLRLGWRVTRRVGIDVFTDGTAGNDGLGHAIHAGGGITYRF